MNAKIVHEAPGRIRLRAGKYAFTSEQSYSIADVLLKTDYVYEVKATSFNGGLLVFYHPARRAALLNTIARLDCQNLPIIPESNRVDVGEEQAEFEFQLVKKVVSHFAFKWLLPAPVRNVITFGKSLKYFKDALESLVVDTKLGVDVLDASSIGISMYQNDYNAASSIMFLLSLSDLLEDYTRKKARSALTKSMALNVDTVWIEDKTGTEQNIPYQNLVLGDLVIVRTGWVIPVDGTIVAGEGFINESSLTGEAQAVRKEKEATVFAGTTLEDGRILVEVKALGGETRLNNIIEMIDDSASLKAGVQERSENLADSIVPFSFATAGLVYLATRDVTKMAAALMVDYSCAIKLSTPITIISAMREASDNKVVVKGGKYLEAYAEADTIIFDKTGTLTVASPTVTEVVSLGELDEDEVLRNTACLEEHFPHSVARAIVQAAVDKDLKHEEEHTEVLYIVAHGIRSSLYGQTALVGSYHFIVEDEGVVVTPEQQAVIDEKSTGKSTIFFALGGKLAGMICLDDPVRPEAREVIADLKAAGIKNVVMLTGDGEAAAARVAWELGIDEYRSQVLPEDKAAVIEEYKANGHRVIMVGDGINDSPALAAADVSVAMNDASDVAREVADISMLAGSLSPLVTLRALSNRAFNRINRNFKFIVGFNSLLLGMGIFGFITPSTSSLLHNVSTMGLSASCMRPLLPQAKDKRTGDLSQTELLLLAGQDLETNGEPLLKLATNE